MDSRRNPNASRRLVEALNQHTNSNFWKNAPNNPSFQDVLDNYAHFLSNPALSASDRKTLSTVFWAQIKEIKTPIIEEISNNKVKVHFLFPRNENDHIGNKLYICGDFHGFSSTNNAKQEMHHKVGTDIMHRSDDMPKDSIVTYRFFQVPPNFQNKNRPQLIPSEALPESFYDTPPVANDIDPLKTHATFYEDKNAKHTDLLPENIFCANVENDMSNVNLLKDADFQQILNADDQYNNYFKVISHRGTYACDRDNHLVARSNAVNDYQKTVFTNKEHTRYVTIFAPKEGQVNHLIIVHDGIGYMLAGAIEKIDALMEKRQIPPDTAVICITSLPGLVEKYKQQSPQQFPDGTDPRATEFATKVQDYVTFIGEAINQLGYSRIPAEKRTLIGASMSGTASLYMVLEHKDKFGNAIAQAPTESTRAILHSAILKRKLDKENGQAEDLSARIKLSCGRFDSREYAQNLRYDHVEELAQVLGGDKNHPLPIVTGNYGHVNCGWSRELTEMLPALYRPQAQPLKNKVDLKKLQSVMQQGRIQKASIASATGIDKPIASNVYQLNEQGNLKETANEVFGVASLSKPVFTYLVLKLVGQQGFNLDTKLSDIMPFSEFCKKYDFIWDPANNDRANSFTT